LKISKKSSTAPKYPAAAKHISTPISLFHRYRQQYHFFLV
jgi:hypothetical protein